MNDGAEKTGTAIPGTQHDDLEDSGLGPPVRPADRGPRPPTAALGALLDLSALLSDGEATLEEVLGPVVDFAVDHLGAEHGIAWMVEGGELRPVAVRGLDPTEAHVHNVSRRLMSRCLSDPTPVYSLDVVGDHDLEGQESLLRHQVASLVAAPIVYRGEVRGLLYVDTRGRKTPLARNAVGFVTLLAVLIGNHVGLQRELRILERETSALRAKLPSPFHDIVCDSPAMSAVVEQLARVADDDCPVLLVGETGTGKEVLCRALHSASARGDGPFVAVNCGALSESLAGAELFGHTRGAFTGATSERRGLIEHAHGGTLLLDEIDSLPPSLQVQFLRVLQERLVRRLGEVEEVPVDFRLVCASGTDLAGLVGRGIFREDLYWRIATMVVRVPPLRERRGDIRPLVDRFVAAASRRRGRPSPEVHEETYEALMRAPWPGNVRQLENEIERLLSLSDEDDELTVDLLSDEVSGTGSQGSSGLAERVQAFEWQLIAEALRTESSNVTAAAERLDMSRQNLQARIRKHKKHGRTF